MVVSSSSTGFASSWSAHRLGGPLKSATNLSSPPWTPSTSVHGTCERSSTVMTVLFARSTTTAMSSRWCTARPAPRRSWVHATSGSESIDTSTPGGRLVFHVFGALAEFERDLIRERTQAGLAAARARGRVGGRPTVWTADKLRAARAMRASGSLH